MKSWPSKPLGALTDVLSGFAFDSRYFSSSDGFPLVRIRDVVAGRTSTYFTGEFDPRYVIDTGDILIGMDGEFNRSRWRGGKALLNQRVCKITANAGELDDRYLFHFLPRSLKAIEAVTPFVTVKHLSVNQIRNVAVPLPPLLEQRRVADILDTADALRAKRRAALAQLDVLAQSIFLDMFGDPAAHGWKMTRLAEVAADTKASVRTGPFGSQLLHSEFTGEGVAVLGIDNVVANEFRWNERRFISAAKYRKLARYTVHPEDVLITIMGTCGRCAIVPSDIPTAINTKHLCCVTLNQERCLPHFLHMYFLHHPMARRYLAQKAKGAIMAGLNMGIVRELPIPLVPIALQETFVARLRALTSVKADCRRSRIELDTLFASIQDSAFLGEL